MQRREFLEKLMVGAGAAAAGATLAGCEGPQPRPPAADQGGEGPGIVTGQNIQWRMASSFPRSLDTIFGAGEYLAQRIAAMTDGAFQIRVYPAGEIVPALQVMDACQQGTVQIGHTASYYYIGKNPALAFDTCVPFGLTSRQQTAWLIEGGGLDLVNELFADFNIRTFPAGNTGVQMGGWFKREISGPSDLKGLKMRIPGMGGKVMSALGVSVQNIAGGEIFPALERGAIDATDWVGPYDDEKLGFHKAANFYYYPGWWEPGPSLSYYVNRAAWDTLPRAYQEIFQAAAIESSVIMQARYDAKNPPAMRRLLAAGVQTRPFSEDLMKAARDAALQMLEDDASKDASYRKIYDHWRGARQDAFRWFGAAELAYAKFSFSGSMG